jgi:hypothetical protein
MQFNDGYQQSSVSTVHLPHDFDLPRSKQQWPARVCLLPSFRGTNGSKPATLLNVCALQCK